jgi:hypothetical protein
MRAVSPHNPFDANLVVKSFVRGLQHLAHVDFTQIAFGRVLIIYRSMI